MSTTVSTINVNGIRAATKIRDHGGRGLLDWFATCTSEVVCLQETRATEEQIAEALNPLVETGWNLYSAPAELKGRSGVAILSRQPATEVQIGFGDNEFKNSGRYIEATFPQLKIASLYLPSGEVDTVKQIEKMQFCKLFLAYLQSINLQQPMLVAGDWNIGHTELDIKNWKANQKKSGFLPEERAWLDALVASGWVDVVRKLNPQTKGPYSWWSYRGKAFDNNAGWRIDYQFTTPVLAKTAIKSQVDRAESYNLRWSDHAPVTVTYELD